MNCNNQPEIKGDDKSDARPLKYWGDQLFEKIGNQRRFSTTF